MHAYFDAEHPLLLAHRGSTILWPENTMAAFEGALSLGVRYLEIDVRLTADGVVVVFHDESVDRLTNGTGLIASWRLEDLKLLDAGYRFREQDGAPRRGRGLTVPTLEEAVAAHPEARWNIDMKSDDVVEPLARLISAHGWEDRVLAASFHDRRLTRFRRLTGGRVATSAGMWSATAAWTASRLGGVIRTDADALQLPQRRGRLTVVDRRLVEAAHAGGIPVHVWTVNAPAEMQGLLGIGVDGLVTDRPDLAARVMGR